MIIFWGLETSGIGNIITLWGWMHNQGKNGKRNIPGVNEELPTSILKVPGSNPQRPPISSFQKYPVADLHKLPVVIDSFGTINILPTDKFGAVQEWDNNQSSSFGSTYSRRFENAEESTGSFNVTLDNKKILEEARGKYHYTESGSRSVNESGWRKNQQDYSTSAATSNPCSSRIYDGSQSNSTTNTCTLDERNSNDNESGLGGPPIKRLRDSSRNVRIFCCSQKFILAINFSAWHLQTERRYIMILTSIQR